MSISGQLLKEICRVRSCALLFREVTWVSSR